MRKWGGWSVGEVTCVLAIPPKPSARLRQRASKDHHAHLLSLYHTSALRVKQPAMAGGRWVLPLTTPRVGVASG